jgi:HD-GYP domain-containing protein (c-di-GMP phosphodiesterase class II)
VKNGLFLDIENVLPGMILNEDIYHEDNLLLPKGTVIKPGYLDKLVSRGVFKVNVCNGSSQYDNFLSNPVEKFYVKAYDEIAEMIDNQKKGIKLDATAILILIEKIMEKVYTNKDSILLLTGFRGKCDYFYAHSLDVCIYSLIAAKALNIDYENTMTLGMGALLHDIGKIKIPDSILLKQGSLTNEEYEEAKKHSIYGYRLVAGISGMKHEAAKIVLQHHERCDGSGYPWNAVADEILFLSKIVAVADIYDALTSDRVYRKKVLPHEAAEYLLCISNSQIDTKIAKVFLKDVAIYPKGCQVLLNTNQIGVVMDSNSKMPLRPLLKILSDRDKHPVKSPFEFELQTHPDVFIVHMFN